MRTFDTLPTPTTPPAHSGVNLKPLSDSSGFGGLLRHVTKVSDPIAEEEETVSLKDLAAMPIFGDWIN